MMVRFSLSSVVALVACLSGTAAAPAPATLANAALTVTFDDRGLTSIVDASAGRRPVSRDDFTITLSGRTYEGRSLAPPSRQTEPGRITYTFDVDGYRLEVVYELRPEWRFVSKQIVIARAPSPTFTVGEVAVLRMTLADPVLGEYVPKSSRPSLQTGDYGACLRFDHGRGLLAAVQNPFLRFERTGSAFALTYNAEMDWDLDRGPFASDRAMLAPYRLTGRVLPASMVPEWRMDTSPSAPGMDEAEVEAFAGAVRAFVLPQPEKPTNLFVGWCVNDYQIDTATPDGRTEYKRIMDRAAELGAEFVLYAPTQSALARREESADDWGWENLLWLGLGQTIRKNEWDPRKDETPADVQEMLDYARSKHLKLVAYVYPVVPFSQNPAWLVPSRNDPARKNASLGVPALQDWLIETLVAFQKRTGIGGYAFDHTFLTYQGTSRYAQWHGWRRVMEEVRRRLPDIVIDGRQAYHLYGPWSWLAGSYPHPTFNDEQPESFVPFPDLHFDRVSANRERYTAYRYRNYDFAPSELVPGFITHQTPRLDDTGRMPQTRGEHGIRLERFRARDWDDLGWRYSLLSSIAVAGLNNVINMIPARDLDEQRAFPAEDITWFRGWLDWTRVNRELLRHTRTIFGQPALGKIDGTSAIAGNRGYVFLFNPNGRALPAELALDESIGLDRRGRFLIKELYPLASRLVGKPGAGFWNAGDRVPIALDGGSALALQIEPAPAAVRDPMLFNAPGVVSLEGNALEASGVKGEAGTESTLLVLLPPGRAASRVRVDGRDMPEAVSTPGLLSIPVRFDGERFAHYQQVGAYDAGFAGGTMTGAFRIPRRVFDQHAARAKAWSIRWTPEDYRTTWLAPERLLLFVQIADPDTRMDVHLKIDGRSVALTKAYSAIRPEPRTFVGFYADVSLLEADREYRVELQLPPMKPGQFQGLFFENVETEYAAPLARRNGR